MIERIYWHDRAVENGENPFRGSGRLKVTFHNTSLNNLSDADKEALQTLRELSYMNELEVYHIGDYDLTNWPEDLSTFQMHYESHLGQLRNTYTEEYSLSRSDRIMPLYDMNGIKPGNDLTDTEVFSLHVQQRGHLLVTASPFILNKKNTELAYKCNARTPSEAAKILGLFLRFCDNYTFWVSQNGVWTFSRKLFYWVYVRYMLPSMWRYAYACLEASKIRNDDTNEIVNSILVRAMFALQARDAIGVQFYQPQTSDSRDVMAYHFNYLLLLLAGIFDAMARIAHRAYRLELAERYASFYGETNFRKELKKYNISANLYKKTSGQKFRNLMKLLYTLRNTIHGADLTPTGISFEFKFQTYNEASFFEILPQYRETIWNAAKQSWSPEDWGLTKEYFDTMMLEPYTYASKLILECLSVINDIADATDLTGLFPEGYLIPQFDTGPPSDPRSKQIFDKDVGKRIATLV